MSGAPINWLWTLIIIIIVIIVIVILLKVLFAVIAIGPIAYGHEDYSNILAGHYNLLKSITWSPNLST